MRKLKRPALPPDLEQACDSFVATCPPNKERRSESERWQLFKNENQHLFSAIRAILEHNQQGLCAYCETQLDETNRQIEHYIPKELTTRDEEWTINFSNYLLACKGNENRHHKDYSNNPSHKANLTCGAKKCNIDPQGKIYNPYELPDEPVIRLNYGEDGIKYEPDIESCRKNGICPETIESTITYLNLNSPNLMRRRKAVWDDLMKEEAKIYGESGGNKEEKLNDLKDEELSPIDDSLPSFITLRKMFFQEK